MPTEIGSGLWNSLRDRQGTPSPASRLRQKTRSDLVAITPSTRRSAVPLELRRVSLSAARLAEMADFHRDVVGLEVTSREDDLEDSGLEAAGIVYSGQDVEPASRDDPGACPSDSPAQNR